MKTLVLSKRFVGKTARKLAKAIGADYGAKVPSDYATYDRLIRWGVTYAPYIDNDIDTVVNRACYISNMANRLRMFQRLHEHDIPTLTLPSALFSGETPYIVRSMHGKWGRDIKIGGNVPKGHFAVEQWPADFEVRVHIVNGISVCIQIKRQAGVTINEPMPEWHIRNRQHGWHLYHLHNSEADRLGIDKHALRETAKQTISTAKLTFGVVDFLVRPDEYKVLEVNTAPGLEDATLARYVERLNA